MPPSGSRAERTSMTRRVENSRSRRRLIVVEQARDALGDEIVRIARPVGAAGGVEAHDFVEAEPLAQHRRRQVEEVGEFAVPARSAPGWDRRR